MCKIHLINLKSFGLKNNDESLNYKDLLSVFNAGFPTRKEQIAFSLFDEDADDDAIARMEIGQDINNFPKCNTNNGSGTQDFFTEGTLPGVSARFTISGTTSSGIRSMWTGSDQTRPCQSRYGIQDIVGNVEEKLESKWKRMMDQVSLK